jgi:hypothetical protein
MERGALTQRVVLMTCAAPGAPPAARLPMLPFFDDVGAWMLTSEQIITERPAPPPPSRRLYGGNRLPVNRATPLMFPIVP